MNIPKSIYSIIDRDWACLHLSAINALNSVTKHINVYIFWSTYAHIPVWYIPKTGLIAKYDMLLLFSHPVLSDSLSPHCPSSCPLHQWCHPAISSSDTLLSFCPQSFPASGNFPMSQLFAPDDQNTGASASASVLPMSIQNWYPLRLTGLISLLSKGLSEVFSSTRVLRHI